MKNLFIVICLSFTLSSWSMTEQGAAGFEAGVARLSDGDKSMIGPSWMFHMEFQADPVIGFFGQAGRSDAKDSEDHFQQTSFVGGLKFNLLPALEFRAGVATEIIEIEKQDSKDTSVSELGPMAAVATYIPVGVFKIGTSATAIRTGSLHSFALRALILVMF